MPRPGPRPYECVRRAWHSDRHRPMRGSLIQEIFRIVSEIHSSATKKNKEWQEKLPVVVLKAEEIMYSKANSEVEYMDVKTLWDRTNDAINTIIRREESTETGELLQPCIEAALILGCTARRASRSQRNSNPRCYLSQSAQEPAPVPPRAPDNVTIGGSSHYPPNHPVNPPSAPRFMPHYPTNSRPAAINSSRFSSEPRTPVTHNNNPIASHGPFASKSFPNQTFAMETNHLANMGHSYPLYYGVPGNSKDSQHVFPPFPGSSLSSADPASPQVHAIVNSKEIGLLENIFTNEGAANAINRNAPADLMDKIECPPEVGCDLSLRLGSFSAHSASEARCSREVEDVELSSPQGGSKCYDFPPKTTKEFCFFPGGNTDEYPESSKWSARDEVLNLDGPSRKRKATFSSHVEGEHFSRRPAFSNNMYFDRMNKQDK